MKLDLEQLALLALFTSSVHWIIARSLAFKPLWSRAPVIIDNLLRCAACSGFWLGLGAGALGLRPVSGLWAPAEMLIIPGLLSTWLTPVAEGVFLWGLEKSAVLDETEKPPFWPEPPSTRPLP